MSNVFRIFKEGEKSNSNVWELYAIYGEDAVNDQMY